MKLPKILSEKRRKRVNKFGIPTDYRAYLISGASFLSAMLVRRVAEYAWKKTTRRDPPKNPEDREVSWGDALAWTLITGVAASLVRLVIRRNVTAGLDDT